MRLSLRMPFLLACAFLTSACATAGGIRQEPLDAGVVHEFTGDFQTVLRAARTAVTNVGLAVDSYDQVNDSIAVIVAKGWGDLVRVAVQGSSTNRVAVRVVTHCVLATYVTAKGDYSDAIFSNIEHPSYALSIAPGTRARIIGPANATDYLTVVSVDRDTLRYRLNAEPGSRAVSWQNVGRMDVSGGSHSNVARSAGAGFLAGFLTGVVTTAVIYPSLQKSFGGSGSGEAQKPPSTR